MKKIAYIAHPIRGDVRKNLERIKTIVRRVNMEEADVVPFVPYFADCVSLDDSKPSQRNRGMENNKTILRSGIVTELRLYGNRISDGMKAEIFIADEMNIPVIPMTDKTRFNYKLIKDEWL